MTPALWNDFGRRLGLPDQPLQAETLPALRLQSGVVMHLLPQQETVLLRIDCPLAFEDDALLERALMAVHWRQGRLLQLGLRGSGTERVLQVATRLPAQSLSAAAIENTFSQLLDWFVALKR